MNLNRSCPWPRNESCLTRRLKTQIIYCLLWRSLSQRSMKMTKNNLLSSFLPSRNSARNWRWSRFVFQAFDAYSYLTLLDFQHTSFSKVDPFTLLAAHIQVGPLLFVAATPMRYEIEALGKADPASSLLSFDSTIKLIKLVRNHVSIMVGQNLISVFNNSRVHTPRPRQDAAY